MLKYWCASMQSLLLPSVDFSADRHEVDWACVVKGQLDSALSKKLVQEFRKIKIDAAIEEEQKQRRDAQEEEKSGAQVIIAPLVFLAEYRDGGARRAQSRPYTPVLIPAMLFSDGRLIQNEEVAPWIYRDALEPSGADEPPIGSLEDFDDFRSTHLRPEPAKWPSVIQYVEDLIAKVAKAPIEDVTVEAYCRGPALIKAGRPNFSTTKHLIGLATYLSEQKAFSGCINALMADGPSRPLLAELKRRDISRQHVGQMEGKYPLAERQREALHHLLASEDGELLAVNGPPGTGKTTLIQSIVANYYVSSALRERDAPVIFAVSVNNNAVTNVLDSFAAAAIVEARSSDQLTQRWLPNLSSFGLWLPSDSKQPDEDKYHVAYLPDYRDSLAGWPATMLDSIEPAEAAYMQTARAYLREDDVTIAEVSVRLLERLRSLRTQLGRCLDASERVEACRAAFAPLSEDQAYIQTRITKGT